MRYNVIAINKDIKPARVTILFRDLPKGEAYTAAKVGRNFGTAKKIVIADDKLESFFLKLKEVL